MNRVGTETEHFVVRSWGKGSFEGQKAESVGGIWRDCGVILSKRQDSSLSVSQAIPCETLEESPQKEKYHVDVKVAPFLHQLSSYKETNSFLLKS